MLAQTNLQLYNTLIRQGAHKQSLAQVRSAYEAARQLFTDSFRPTHKPFIAHLVGTAAALALWGERTDLVVAGLLHSAYLYGYFGDGEKKLAPRRRRWLTQQIGGDAEELVAAYTAADWRDSAAVQSERARQNPRLRDLLVLKLADTLDECSDGGILYSAAKKLPFGDSNPAAARTTLRQLSQTWLTPAAAEQFEAAFALEDSLRVPEGLVSPEAASKRLAPGIPGLRRSWAARQVVRFVNRFQRDKAA